MSFTRNLLIFLLLAQLGFSLWTQSLNISAVDQSGKPVEKAQVTVLYQKASQVSENDGVLTGETNADGYFVGEITNRVPAATASKNIQVRVSTAYWAGETRKLVANESEKKQVRFIVPFRLEDVYVRVLSSRQLLVKGAEVVISGKMPIKKATGADGRARFFFPSNFTFGGFVSYSNTSTAFTSRQIALADGKKTINVTLPPLEGEILGSVAGEGRNSLGIAFFGFNDTALADRKVLFTFEGKNYTVYTDSEGVAGFLSDKTGVLNATIREYDYDFRYSFNISPSNNTTSVSLQHLLRVVSFDSLQDGDNCFKLLANVSDPRPTVPVRVRMFKYEGAKNTTLLTVNVTASGLYYSQLCVKSDTQVRLTASNKYDTAESSLNLTFVRPKGPAPAKPSNQTGLSGTGGKKEETDDMVIVAIVLLLVCILSAFFARAYLVQSSRFIVEYVRKANEGIQKRRQKRGIPPVVPLSPYEDAQHSPPGEEQPPQQPPSQPPAD